MEGLFGKSSGHHDGLLYLENRTMSVHGKFGGIMTEIYGGLCGITVEYDKVSDTLYELEDLRDNSERARFFYCGKDEVCEGCTMFALLGKLGVATL